MDRFKTINQGFFNDQELDLIEPEVDSLRVVDIRSLLSSRGVEIPIGVQKKQDLVALLTKHIEETKRNQSTVISVKTVRTVTREKIIVDKDEEEEEEKDEKKTDARRSTRKSVPSAKRRVTMEEEEEPEPRAKRLTRKSTSYVKSKPQDSESEEEEKPKPKKSKSTTTPAKSTPGKKKEEDQEDEYEEEGEKEKLKKSRSGSPARSTPRKKKEEEKEEIKTPRKSERTSSVGASKNKVENTSDSEASEKREVKKQKKVKQEEPKENKKEDKQKKDEDKETTPKRKSSSFGTEEKSDPKRRKSNRFQLDEFKESKPDAEEKPRKESKPDAEEKPEPSKPQKERSLSKSLSEEKQSGPPKPSLPETTATPKSPVLAEKPQPVNVVHQSPHRSVNELVNRFEETSKTNPNVSMPFGRKETPSVPKPRPAIEQIRSTEDALRMLQEDQNNRPRIITEPARVPAPQPPSSDKTEQEQIQEELAKSKENELGDEEFRDPVALMCYGVLIAYFVFSWLFVFAYYPSTAQAFCTSEILVTPGSEYNYQDPVNCVPCPPHGLCWKGNMECEKGFTRQYDKCVEDVTIVQNAYKIISEMHHILAHRQGRYICETEVSPEESELSLREKMSKFPFFDADGLAFARAQEIVAEGDRDGSGGDSHIHVRGTDVGERFFSTDKRDAHLPAICNLQITFKNHFMEIITFFAIISGMFYLYYLYKERERFTVKVDRLIGEIHLLLQNQQLKARKDSTCDPDIAANHVRDTFLLNLKQHERDRLWNAAKKRLDSDTRVRQYPKSLHGEQTTVMEWIAPVPDLIPTRNYSVPSGPTIDSGSSTAVESRYQEIFPARTFRK